jgi:non-ribosomal peptide synthetase component F
VGDLDLFGAGERDRVVSAWNDTAYPVRPVSVLDLIEEQARSRPDAVAVTGEDGRLTYGELNAAADGVAAWLTARGAGPETVVAVSLPRSVRLVTTLLGVWKAGAAYLPVDPGYPPARAELMTRDAGAVVVIDGATGEIPPAPARPARVPLDHRNAEGRAGVAPGDREPAVVDAGPVPAERRGPGGAEDPGGVRRVGVGVLLAAVDRRSAGGGASGRSP